MSSDKQETVYILRSVGLNLRQVAELMGVHRSTVKNWLRPEQSKLRMSRFEAKRGGYVPCSASITEVTKSRRTQCDICGEAELTAGVMCLDHCHITGRMRGWLCRGCNAALGLLKDDLSVVEAAAEYLRRAHVLS